MWPIAACGMPADNQKFGGSIRNGPLTRRAISAALRGAATTQVQETNATVSFLPRAMGADQEARRWPELAKDDPPTLHRKSLPVRKSGKKGPKSSRGGNTVGIKSMIK